MAQKIDSTKIFAALRPAGFDEDAQSSHAGQHTTRLAEILATEGKSDAHRHRTARRFPALRLTAGLAVTAAAVATITVSLGDHHSSGPVADQPIDARQILLASATTAERAPVESGAYWYTKESDVERLTEIKYTKVKVPFTAYVTHDLEVWDGSTRTRTSGDHHVKITFGSPADEAKWKAMGSPALYGGAPFVNNYTQDVQGTMIGNHTLSLKQVAALPTDTKALETLLRKLFTTDAQAGDFSGKPSSPDFASYVWGAAQSLMDRPLTPRTRAALYRVLAGQPGITAQRTTDPVGRSGVALTEIVKTPAIKAPSSRKQLPGLPAETDAWSVIIDPSTGQPLASEHRAFAPNGKPQVVPDHTTTYQIMSWTDHI